jgi:hypothetical protein
MVKQSIAKSALNVRPKESSQIWRSSGGRFLFVSQTGWGQGMREQEFLERLCYGGQVFAFALHHVPVAHDREMLNWQDDQAGGFQLQ